MAEQTSRMNERVEWAGGGVLAAIAIILILWFAGDWGRRQAAAELRIQARSNAALDVAVLDSELEKQRSLPFILAQDPDILTTLLVSNVANVSAMNRKLATLNGRAQSDVIYLLNHQAKTIASSNWQDPTSFVGKNYSFRPYFVQAMQAGQAEYFALGNVSLRAGLYISRRVDYDGAALGVIVVKVEFDDVEQVWRQSDATVYVTEPRGVVLLSNVTGWHFLTQFPLQPSQIAAIHASAQFGRASLKPLPVHPAETTFGPDFVTLAHGKLFLGFDQDIPSTPWRLHVLLPAQAALAAGAYTARLTGVSVAAPILLLLAIMLYWRQRSRVHIQEELAARAALEREVAARTTDLRLTNTHLVAEIDERQNVELNLQTTRDELAQTNRLAILGQVTAGLAHEVNQPLAAIRTYADNAVVYLNREDVEAVRLNLANIAKLTELIGSITGELRGFSRKATGPIGPTCVQDVVAGALLLVGTRARQQAVELTAEPADPALHVIGNRVRLVQVLVNLLQNALEAAEGHSCQKLHIGVSCVGDEVQIVVADNGPGILPDVMAALFTPFFTTKPRGVGLGLVISKNIINEFGGRLNVVSEPDRGTCFTMSLQKATL